MSQITEQSWANIVARFDGMAAQADDAEARMDGYIAGAQAQMPALNVLKNASATADDGAGDFTSPLNIWTADVGSLTIATQRVLAHDDPDIPADIAGKLVGQGGLPQYSFNCIEVTLSQNGGTGQFRLLAHMHLRGHYTSGAMWVQPSASGIVLEGADLPVGAATYNIHTTINSFHNVNGLNGIVTGESKKLFVALPYVCAGKVSAPPLFLNNEGFYLGEPVY